MTDKPSNYDLDDELLSAYLDGALSVDERAAVETRLANDPAAQQLLHELRSVSQSVQALPTESLGRDLSDEIIRRARFVRGSSDPAPSPDRRSPSTPPPEIPSGNALPKIKIFGSRRAWIWASMALAAGLLIMIVQSGDESAKKLPPVAARNQDSAQIHPTDEAAEPPHREISISAPKTPSAPLTTITSEGANQDKQVDALGGAMPAAPIASEPRGVQMRSTGELGAAAAPPVAGSAAPKTPNEVGKAIAQLDDASSTVTALPEQVATDKSAAARHPADSLSGISGAPGMSAGNQKSESIANPTGLQFFVVHVVATPDALKKGSFDKLLADNKIEFVPQPAKDQSFGFGGRKLAQPAESETRAKEQPNKAAETHAATTEMVLVEAPAPAIESCLAGLNKNANDFVSIAVNEGRQSQDRFDKLSTTKSLAENPKDFSRFSRGTASEAQMHTIDPRKYFYSYDLDKPDDLAKNGSSRGGEAGKVAGAAPDANDAKKWHDETQPPSDIRRARSIASWGIDNRQSGEAAEPSSRAARIQPQSSQSGAETTNQPLSQQKPTAHPEAKADHQNDNLKVLFVFTSEDATAPGAPSDNRPK